MKVFKLAQRVNFSLNRKEWIDLYTSQNHVELRDYAQKIRKLNPNAELSLRRVEETELEYWGPVETPTQTTEGTQDEQTT